MSLTKKMWVRLLLTISLVVIALVVAFLAFPTDMKIVVEDALRATLNEYPHSPHPQKEAMTTLFWIGEGAGAESAGIANVGSFWDSSWQEHYGGVDDPTNRCGFSPCAFVPQENPFYVALPYAEFEKGVLKKNATHIPWYRKVAENESLLKNRWVEIRYRDRVCYGQWEDVGPNELDDAAYVFGTRTVPINTFGVRAGLDISPALWTCLGMTDNDTTTWRFIDASEVPTGPWKETVTTRDITWE